MVTGLLLAIILSQIPGFNQLIKQFGAFGYFSAFFAGALFASTFTIATGALILIDLTTSLPLTTLAIIGALGAVIADLSIFLFTRGNIPKHISPVYQKIIGSHLRKIIHTKYFSWTLPVIGALIIASPLPDELGVSLLSISQIKTYQFALISYCSHLIGISLILASSLF